MSGIHFKLVFHLYESRTDVQTSLGSTSLQPKQPSRVVLSSCGHPERVIEDLQSPLRELRDITSPERLEKKGDFFMLSYSRQWGTLGQRSHVSKLLRKEQTTKGSGKLYKFMVNNRKMLVRYLRSQL